MTSSPRTGPPVHASPTGIVVREIQAGDEAAIKTLLDGLDAEARYLRWFTGGADIPRAEAWAAHPERFAAIGLLAFAGAVPVGHAVLIPAGGGRGEVAFEVAAGWRRHGIAGLLLRRLVVAAAGLRLHEIYAEVLTENRDMLAVMRESGPHSETHDGGITVVTVPVQPSSNP